MGRRKDSLVRRLRAAFHRMIHPRRFTWHALQAAYADWYRIESAGSWSSLTRRRT